MPSARYYAYTKIPYYVAYRCSKCNTVNVFTGCVLKEENYGFIKKKEDALSESIEKAEKRAAELTVLENVKKTWVLPHHTCNKCKYREPWSFRMLLLLDFLIPFIAILMLVFSFPSIFLIGNLGWLMLAFSLVLGGVYAIVRSKLESIEAMRLSKLDDVNMPHIALDKEGLIECLKIVDPQNEYGNLDDFENTLYAEREEGYGVNSRRSPLPPQKDRTVLKEKD